MPKNGGIYGRKGFLARKDVTGNRSENRVMYFHKLAYATAGYTTRKYFNAAKADEVTNWVTPNRVPEDFILEQVGFGVRPAAMDGTYTDLTDSYKIWSSGQVKLTINGNELISIFPIGASGNVMPLHTSMATNETAAANVFRGFVDVIKAPFNIVPAVSLVKDWTLELEIVWANKVTVTTESTLTAYLIGHRQKLI